MFKTSSLLTSLLCLAAAAEAPSARADGLRITSGFQTGADLESWEIPQLKHEKRVVSREKDPLSGKVIPWDGVLLSSLVEKSLAKLNAEQRANVDLLILRSRSGQQVHLPRSLIQKYPLLVAFSPENSLEVVVPWTSKPKIQEEGFPLQRYFLKGLSSIELSSYQAKYQPLFLSRRTDPAAVRGERVFVQNCMGCHNSEPRGPASQTTSGASAALPPKAHPTVPGFATLPDRDRRALGSYFEAFRLEHPQPIQAKNP